MEGKRRRAELMSAHQTSAGKTLVANVERRAGVHFSVPKEGILGAAGSADGRKTRYSALSRPPTRAPRGAQPGAISSIRVSLGTFAKPGRLGRPSTLSRIRCWCRSASRAVISRMTKPATILFVEDDDAVRGVLAEALTAKGFRVLAAESGHHARDVLARDHVDVLFTDVVMPDLNGIELVKEARRTRPDLPVVMMTAYFSRAKEAAGLAKLLFKPLRPRSSQRSMRLDDAKPLTLDRLTPAAGR